MNGDGVAGTAGDWAPAAGKQPAARVALFIKRDDERLGRRYIGPRYPPVSRRSPPQNLRRERQVASALLERSDFMVASVICDGCTGKPGGAAARSRVRSAAGG
jgi:hypothetical protein